MKKPFGLACTAFSGIMEALDWLYMGNWKMCECFMMDIP